MLQLHLVSGPEKAVDELSTKLALTAESGSFIITESHK